MSSGWFPFSPFFWQRASLCRSCFGQKTRFLVSQAHSWRETLGSLEDSRAASEEETAKAGGAEKVLHDKYLLIQRTFHSRINHLRATNWAILQGIPFERFLAEVLQEWGYEVATTKVTGDQGVDLIVSKRGTDRSSSEGLPRLDGRQFGGAGSRYRHEVLPMPSVRCDHKLHVHFRCSEIGGGRRVSPYRSRYAPFVNRRQAPLVSQVHLMRVRHLVLEARTPGKGCRASSASTPLWGASGMVGMGAYSIGSKMPTVL